MKTMMKFVFGVAAVALPLLVALPYVPGGPVNLSAQKGARIPVVNTPKPRLDAMELAFKLTKEQKTHVKTLMDEAHKAAQPIRDGLVKTHADIALAIQGNKGQEAIAAATKAYAEQATAMMAHEVKALAAIMKELTEEQRANRTAVSQTFWAMRSAFLAKNWNELASEARNY
jgi:Spy/CpxP family protein refolding chaperone